MHPHERLRMARFWLDRLVRYFSELDRAGGIYVKNA
jgi:hypothetical protein